MPEPYDESRDPIPISALQHWCYCPRQCGLIHLEQAFEENVHTLRGRAVHSAVDTPGLETRAGVRTERALPLFHDRLGLVGKADAVEFESGAETRLSVDLILDRLAAGWTAEDLFKSYPRLTPEALRAVFAFAAEVLKDEDYVARAKAAA